MSKQFLISIFEDTDSFFISCIKKRCSNNNVSRRKYKIPVISARIQEAEVTANLYLKSEGQVILLCA